MDDPCRIRPADARDVAAVHAVERAAFSDPWSERQLRECLHADFDFLVAEREAAVVGYVVTRSVADEAEILNLSVSPGSRRAGIGRALVRAAVGRARGRGVHRVYLEVRESNGPARRLYESEGFALVGRRPRYYCRPVEDAILLRAVIMAGEGDAKL
jgi:ribosomal-protein-alanine N-acetyltransferase